MLGHYDFGEVPGVRAARRVLPPFVLGVVHVLPVDEHNNVGILLDATAVPQVGKHRTVACPVGHATAELRAGENADVQVPGHALQ